MGTKLRKNERNAKEIRVFIFIAECIEVSLSTAKNLSKVLA